MASEPRISPRTCALLAREPAFRRLRVAYRADPETYADLLALTVIGLGWEAGSVNATALAIGSPAVDDCAMTTIEAAAFAGVRPVTIRRACREGRVTASLRGGRWLVPAAEVARYAEELHGY